MLLAPKSYIPYERKKRMTPIFITLSYWFHNLATVIFIGHFVLLAVVYLPALAENPAILSSISKRSRPLMYTSISPTTIRYA